jgi:hypothetical protein
MRDAGGERRRSRTRVLAAILDSSRAVIQVSGKFEILRCSDQIPKDSLTSKQTVTIVKLAQ